MPDRHIFEVASDGVAHATGETAAREPSRAIARRSDTPPAVDAPPPSLSAPAEEPKRTKPARRRRAPRKGATGELEGSASALALPAADEKPKRTKKSSTAEKRPSARKKKSTASTSKKS
jgi:hypothetical protein